MMDLSLVGFALVSLVVVTTPGPTVLLAMSNGARFGPRAAVYGILGAALSDLFLICAVALGLGALLAASAFWFAVLKWIGAAYLIWIGLQMLMRAAPQACPPQQSGATTASRRSLPFFRKSFLVAVSNPKGYVFFTAFLPQFLTPCDPLIAQYVTLAAIFVAADITAMAAYATLGRTASHCLSPGCGAWIERGSGGTLIALGGSLALLERGRG